MFSGTDFRDPMASLYIPVRSLEAAVEVVIFRVQGSGSRI